MEIDLNYAYFAMIFKTHKKFFKMHAFLCVKFLRPLLVP